MTVSTAEGVAARLVDEIHADLGGLIDEAAVRHAVRQAMVDLAGSVTSGSLPEMASRLAAARLDAKLLTSR